MFLGSLIFPQNSTCATVQLVVEWYFTFLPCLPTVAKEKTNTMLSTYHPGVYGLHVKDRWSCCGRTLRECDGCMNAVGTMKALGMDITSESRVGCWEVHVTANRGKGMEEREEKTGHVWAVHIFLLNTIN